MNGESLEQQNLPFTFSVLGKQFESFVKLYFGNDDAFRRLEINQTYLAVGVDRNSTLGEFIENIYQKLATRLSPQEIQRMILLAECDVISDDILF